MKKNRFFQNEGFALVSTFILILIVLTLITILINISINEFNQAELNKNKTKAYFLARSGAEMTAEAIMNKEFSAQEITFVIRDQDHEKDISEINMTKNGVNYLISSTSNVNDILETVRLSLIKRPLFEYAAYTINGFELEDGYIKNGDIGTLIAQDPDGETIIKSNFDEKNPDLNIEYEVEKNLSYDDYPPDYIEGEGKNLVVEDSSYYIPENYMETSKGNYFDYYESIKVESTSGILNFVLPPDSGDLELVVDTFLIEDYAELKIVIDNYDSSNSEGRVIIYTNNFKAEDGAKISVVENVDSNEEPLNDPNRFLIMNNFKTANPEDENMIKIETVGDFVGGVYAPYSTVKMETTGKILGAIIADKYIIQNSLTTLEYSKIDMEDIVNYEDYKKGKWSD